MIHRFTEPMTKTLFKFYQICWKSGTVSSAWKEALVVAIPKDGKPRHLPTSYRPIALTPHLCKVYVRLVKNTLECFFEKQGILLVYQAGFLKDRSCMEHVVRLSGSASKATGEDPISYHLIRWFPESMIEILLEFYQTCWESGTIPVAWKDALVIAIPKEGKPRHLPTSYRPIALTPHLGKVYERLIKNRLEYLLEKQGILPVCQAGFRKGRNCMEHVVRLSEHVQVLPDMLEVWNGLVCLEGSPCRCHPQRWKAKAPPDKLQANCPHTTPLQSVRETGEKHVRVLL